MSENEQWAIARVQHWWPIICEKISLDLPCPRVVFSSRLKKCAGLASVSRNTVKYSTYFMSIVSRTQYERTIVHELAHIAIDRLHRQRMCHSAPWKNLMVSLGVDSSRCHSYPVQRTRYQTKCLCGKTITFGKIVYRRILIGTYRYSCRDCRRRVLPENVAQV